MTLALSGIVLQVITATRDWTGGSLGYTPERTKGNNIVALQFDDKIVWYLIALAVWLSGLLIWHWVDRSMSRYAMEAISEDEDAAAAAGVNVTAEKLRITVISALMTALAGALYCQYQMFISPDTVSGIAVSLQMVFAVVVGGIYVALGPTVGAIITLLLAEFLRIFFGTKAVGWDNLVYGVLLVLFIIFLPKGILGSILDRLKGKPVDDGAGAQARLGAAERGDAERRLAAAHGQRRQGFGDDAGRQGRAWPAGRPRPARRGRRPWPPRAAAPRRSACRRHRRSRARTSPISPATISPQCRAARNSGTTPNRRRYCALLAAMKSRSDEGAGEHVAVERGARRRARSGWPRRRRTCGSPRRIPGRLRRCRGRSRSTARGSALAPSRSAMPVEFFMSISRKARCSRRGRT